MKVSKVEDAPGKEGHGGAVMHEVITNKDGAPNFAMRVIEVQSEPGKGTRVRVHKWVK